VNVLTHLLPTFSFFSYSTDESKTYSYGRTTIQLISIDPNTGDTAVVRECSNQKSQCQLGTSLATFDDHYYILNRFSFDSSYNRIVATKVFHNDGATHIGWIDTNGNFTDVSQEIVPPAGDFSGAIQHRNPKFGPDNYLYFYNEDLAGTQIVRVPSSNFSEASIEVMDDDVDLSTYIINPDGTASDVGRYVIYSDPSMLCNAPHGGLYGGIYDWVTPTTCIGPNMDYCYSVENCQICLYDAQTDPDPYGNVINERPLLPDIDNRINYNGIVSPDGKQIAFLSHLTIGTDTPALFLVSSSGGEPTKVQTTYVFGDGDCLLIWK
jgi:hypothetical protein